MSQSLQLPSDLVLEVAQSKPVRMQGSLRCAAGQLLALVGPSGAGKSSLLRLIAGLSRGESGRVQVGGELWWDSQTGVCRSVLERQVGMVFQNYALMPHLNALQNVMLALLHLPPPERQLKAQSWLHHVGLASSLHGQNPAKLSGGEQQRVAIARALAREPKLLLLDEPFSAVDQLNRQTLYALLADLRKSLAIPIILVTHDLNEARLLADSIAVMDEGEILQQASPAHIHRAPRNARVANLVGIQNRFVGRWLGACETADGVPYAQLEWLAQTDAVAATGSGLQLKVLDKGRLETGQIVHWVVPSDGLVFNPDPNADNPELRSVLSARIVRLRHLGEISLVDVELDHPAGVQIQLTLTSAARQNLQLQQQVRIGLLHVWIHIMPVKMG